MSSKKKSIIISIIVAVLFAIVVSFIKNYAVTVTTVDSSNSSSEIDPNIDRIMQKAGIKAENGYTFWGLIDIFGRKAIGYTWAGEGMPYSKLEAEDENFAIAAYLAYISKDNYGRYVDSAWNLLFGTLSKVMSSDTQSQLRSNKNGGSMTENSPEYQEAKAYAEFCKQIENGDLINTNHEKAPFQDKGDKTLIGPLNLTKFVTDTSGTNYQFSEGTKNIVRIAISIGKTEKHVLEYNFSEGKPGKDTGTIVVTNASGTEKSITDIKVNEPFYILVSEKSLTPSAVDYIRIYDSCQLYNARIELYSHDGQSKPTGEGYIPKDFAVGSNPYGDYVEWLGEKEEEPEEPDPTTEIKEDFALRKGITQITRSAEKGGETITFDEETRGVTKSPDIGKMTNFPADIGKNSTIDNYISGGAIGSNGGKFTYEKNPYYSGKSNPTINDYQHTATYGNKSSDITDVWVGDKITYTIRVYNEGANTLNGPQVVDYIPSGLKLAKSSTNEKYGWKYAGTTTIKGVEYKKYVSDYLKGQSIDGMGNEKEPVYIYEKEVYDPIKYTIYTVEYPDGSGYTTEDSSLANFAEGRGASVTHTTREIPYWRGLGKYCIRYSEESLPSLSSDYRWNQVGSTETYIRKNFRKQKIKISSEFIQIECEVDKVGNGGDGYLHNIAEISGLKDRDSTPNNVHTPYDFKTNNGNANFSYQEDDDDWDVVHKVIDVGGIVFVDGQMAKEQENVVDGYYNLGEYPKAGVKVELIKEGETKAFSYKGKTYKQETDENGRYLFEKVPSDYSYYVKFTYDGVEWIATQYTHGKGNELRDSDGQEDDGERDALNEKFSEMTYEKAKEMEEKPEIKNISAKTDPHSGAESTDLWKRLNQGLVYRTKVDLALFKDVMQTDIIVNGKHEVYKYNMVDQAKTGIFYDDVRAKTKEGVTFYQGVYPEDVNDGANSFSLYVTYRITIYNEGATKTSLDEVVDYYDKNFEIYKIQAHSTADTTGYEISKSETKQETATADYNALHIPLKGEALEGAGKWYIDITLKLNNAADILRSRFDAGIKYGVTNYAEVTKFSTKENDKYRKGVIDVDSAPGNYLKDGKSEDDNSKAPALYFVRNNPRIITGNVWEAISNQIKNSADLYKNNGTLLEYNKNYPIKDIKVELVEVKNGNLQVKQTTNTDQNGNYKFESYIPGDYIIRFTYGEKGNEIEGRAEYTYDGNKYKAIINGENYQSTQANPNENVRNSEGYRYWYANNTGKRYSDAYDDTTKRMGQIESLSDVYSYEKARRILDRGADDYYAKDNQRKDIDLEMTASTGLMNLEVEKATRRYTNTFKNGQYNEPIYIIDNIDFGLTPRTVTDISIEKNIKHIKLTLSDGTVQIDADIDAKTKTIKSGGKIKGISYLPASSGSEPWVKIELEDELIQGAKLEITYDVIVKNDTSEEALRLYEDESGNIVAIAYYKEDASKLTVYEPETTGKNNVLVTNVGNYYIANVSKDQYMHHTVEISQLVDHSGKLAVNTEEQTSWKKDLDEDQNGINHTTIRIDQDEKYKEKYGYDIRGEMTCVILNRSTDDITLKAGETLTQEIVMTAIIPQQTSTDPEDDLVQDLEYYNNAVVTKLRTNVGRIADITPIGIKTDETRILDPAGITSEPKTNYYIIAAVSGVILVAGIIIIKKFAIRKNDE